MKLLYQSITDKGLVRDINQDAIFTYENEEEDFALFCVADGMGGHERGEKASSYIVEEVEKWCLNFYSAKYEYELRYVIDDFDRHLSSINEMIHLSYNKTGICGSTLILLLLYRGQFAVFSVGDSHIYLKRKITFNQLSKDDVWENNAANIEGLSEEEIVKHPDYGKLTKAVGVFPVLIPSIYTDKLYRNDVFLLCSDGVYKYCKEKYLRRVLTEYLIGVSPDHIIRNIVLKINENKTKDNYSCIVLKIVET